MEKKSYKKLKKKLFFKKLEIIFKISLFILKKFYHKFKNNTIKKIFNNYNYEFILKKLLVKQNCIITQKNRSIYKICGLSRFRIKEYINLGFIPNLTKLS